MKLEQYSWSDIKFTYPDIIKIIIDLKYNNMILQYKR